MLTGWGSMSQKVFVNRFLNMRRIKYIGLDMDHTLIRYNSVNFETLVYKLMVEYLVSQKNYPSSCLQLAFNFHEAIRGLVIDSRNGNILKLTRYGSISEGYHGTNRLSQNEQYLFYRSTYVDLTDPNFISIDTSFSIAVCVLYGQLVDIVDSSQEKLVSYDKIARDVLKALDVVHSNNSLKSYVCSHLDEFVNKDEVLVEGLKRYVRDGKKIFILTNSDYAYTKLLLDYAISPFLREGEHWTDLFEYVITMADKPRFFYDNLKFMKIDPASGLMSNLTGHLVPGIYQGGCATKFTEDLHLNGDDILYIGDHIYGDVLRLKKDCNWRTALVVEELGREIEAYRRVMPIEKTIDAFWEKKLPLEQRYIDLAGRQIDEGTDSYEPEMLQLLEKMSKINEDIAALLQKQKVCFNKKWDQVFRAGAEESLFAHQVNRFACIYMEKIADLFTCPPRTSFTARRRLLAHELAQEIKIHK